MKSNLFAAASIVSTVLVATSAATAESSAEVRAEIFDGVVKTVSEQFYDPAFHGVDWPGVQARYRARLREVADDAAL